MTDQEMMELEPEILKACSEAVSERDHLTRLVVKEQWPTSNAGAITFEPNATIEGEVVDYQTRTYRLKHAAVHSPRICIYDSVDKQFIKQSMTDIAYWMWSSFFRDELLTLIKNRAVVRDLPEIPVEQIENLTRIVSANCKRINLFGKFVPRFISQKSSIGLKYVLNPKYSRAAEQIIFFHPDIAYFQFPKDEQWVGEITWRNIPDRELNPDSKIGLYRLVTTAAAKPIRPDLGLVVTVVPKGLRGFIYYWSWKLFQFVP